MSKSLEAAILKHQFSWQVSR